MTQIRAYKLPELNKSTKDFNYENHTVDNPGKSAKLILQAFDTDNQKGVLSRAELDNALKYLRVLENKCSIQGQKSDGIISELDFVHAIENDKKFSTVKTQLPEELNIKDVAANVLSMLQSALQGKNITFTNYGITGYSEYRDKKIPPERLLNKPIYVNKLKDTTIYKDGNNEFGFALNKDGQHIDNPEEVAKMLGIKSNFSILKFKTEYRKRISDNYVVYYNWNNNTKEFVKDRVKVMPISMYPELGWVPYGAPGPTF